jgi:hypothetical protein
MAERIICQTFKVVMIKIAMRGAEQRQLNWTSTTADWSACLPSPLRKYKPLRYFIGVSRSCERYVTI